MKSLVAIPVHNEARFVQGIVKQVRKYVDDILVIDDGSTDDTEKLLAEIPYIFVIRHPENLGYGKALIDAFTYAVRMGYDWLITVDADGQHDPGYLPEFLAACAADDCDVISGSRYLLAGEADDTPPPDRRAINAEMTALINRVLELRLTDAFCGFKAYRVAALKRLRVSENGYAMPMEFWVQAAVHGLRVREIPVRLVYNDPNRSFGGRLDDPEFRRRHYISVFRRADRDGVQPEPILLLLQRSRRRV